MAFSDGLHDLVAMHGVLFQCPEDNVLELSSLKEHSLPSEGEHAPSEN